MHVLLVDVDSKIPNLALMKLSAYHKQLGDQVGFVTTTPDLIYVSIIFSKNRHHGSLYRHLFPRATVKYGGPGWDPKIKLDPAVEQTSPDLTLYKSRYSVARVTSGCYRRCPFCIVPLLDPQVRYILSPAVQHKKGTILRILDDNILFSPPAFEEVITYARSHNVRVRFEYLDIRLLTEEQASQLKTISLENNTLFFSFDYITIEGIIREKVAMLFRAGFVGRSIKFLLYCGGESELVDLAKRWSIVREELGCEAFAMFNQNSLTSKLRRIRRKLQRPALYRNRSITELFELTDFTNTEQTSRLSQKLLRITTNN